MILKANKVTKIVQAKPRAYVLIENLTNSNVYLSSKELEIGEYVANSPVFKQNGILELNPCVYQGSFYAVSDTDSDIRVLEL